MWIRTQNKEQLINCDNIYITVYDIFSGGSILLGKYATHERALEVLDEIEQYVVGKLVINKKPFYEEGYARLEEIPTTIAVVYHMPED